MGKKHIHYTIYILTPQFANQGKILFTERTSRFKEAKHDNVQKLPVIYVVIVNPF